MKKILTEHDTVFDGFCHRSFNEACDGWRNVQADAAMYPAVQNARDVLAMFDEINDLRSKVWEQERELKRLRPLAGYGDKAA